MNINKQKNVIWNTIGSTANAFTSLLFTLIVTRINGTGIAGIYSFSFATAMIIYCFANYIIRSFQVTDTTDDFSDTDYIFVRVFTCLFSVVLIIVFCLINNYSAFKFLSVVLFSVFRISEAFIEVFYSVIQKKDLLYKVGISMTLRAFFDVLIFLITDLFFKNIIFSAVSMIIVNMLIFIIFDIPVVKTIGIKSASFNLVKFRKILVSGFFTFAVTTLGIIILNISRYAIDLYSNDYFQAIFGYIIMPATFMNLLGQYVIHPSLTEISSSIKNNDCKSLTKIIYKDIGIVFILGIIVLVIAYFAESPVLSLIYGIDLSKYKNTMMLIIAGSVFFGLEFVVSYILIAFRKTLIQFIIYLSVAVFSVFYTFLLVKKYSLFGAGLSFLISMIIVFILLFAFMVFYLNKYNKEWKNKEN